MLDHDQETLVQIFADLKMRLACGRAVIHMLLSQRREFYIHLRDWILETEINSYRCGRVFEYVWHMLFGEPAQISPVPECTLLDCDEDTAKHLPDSENA